MDEWTMTNEQVTAWCMIGADMGYEFDELGHPYQPGAARDIDGSPYTGCFDWRPLEVDSDCLGVMLHYNLTVTCEPECVTVRNALGAIAGMVFYKHEHDQKAALRRAVFEAAARVVRQTLREIDATPTNG